MDKKVKKIPMRQCLGCNEHKPKAELLRVVRAPDETVSLDFRGKKSGRGAYVCRDAKCLRRVRKSKRVEKALDCEIPESIWDEMENALAEELANGGQ